MRKQTDHKAPSEDIQPRLRVICGPMGANGGGLRGAQWAAFDDRERPAPMHSPSQGLVGP